MAEARAAYERFELAKLKLFHRVEDGYYELAYLARAIAITRENMDLLKYLEGVARSRYQVAAAQHADVIRAQVELGKLEDQLRTLDDLRQPVAAKLNAALNRPQGSPIPWPKTIPEEEADASSERAMARMLRENPELKSLEADLKKQVAAVDLAKRDYYPDVAFGLDYVDTGGARMRTSDSGKDPVIAKVSVNLPIWRRKYRAAEREAKARLRSARRAKEDHSNTLAAELELALFKFRDAERKIDLFRDALVPKAEQSLRATETAYKGGKMDFLNLIDAQRVLLSFRLAQERALADRGQRLAELEMLIGGRIRGAGPEKAEVDGQSTPAPAPPVAATEIAKKPQTLCPVMGKKIDKTVYFDYQGQRVYFCCPPCIDIFREDPGEYLKKLEAEREAAGRGKSAGTN